jgi:hypothetical protein
VPRVEDQWLSFLLSSSHCLRRVHDAVEDELGVAGALCAVQGERQHRLEQRRVLFPVLEGEVEHLLALLGAEDAAGPRLAVAAAVLVVGQHVAEQRHGLPAAVVLPHVADHLVEVVAVHVVPGPHHHVLGHLDPRLSRA